MTSLPNIDRDFLMAVARFHHVTKQLLAILNRYPAALVDAPGASGKLSARQTIAVMCGWMAEAHRRYNEYDQHMSSAMYLDTTSFNRFNIAVRSSLNWADCLHEFSRLRHDLIKHAISTDVNHRTADPRYREWLVNLAERCDSHCESLSHFAGLRSESVSSS
jgi:hypothetical protein